ncbi:MAG TPA: DinB family protein [bacterium]|jgi:uncharacterized damage-inducible protein DinB
MRAYLQKLFAHEQWANHKLLTALQAAPSVPSRTAELCPHIMAAHGFWEQRLAGEAVDFRRFEWFPQLSVEECLTRNEQSAQHWARYLAALPDPLDRQTLTFPSPNGPVTLRIVDILTQLHGHSIHHRAQISTDLRAAGLEPVITDYIWFCREQQG